MTACSLLYCQTALRIGLMHLLRWIAAARFSNRPLTNLQSGSRGATTVLRRQDLHENSKLPQRCSDCSDQHGLFFSELSKR